MRENFLLLRARRWALINPFLGVSFQSSVRCPSIGNGKIRGQLEFRTGPSATTDADRARMECSRSKEGNRVNVGQREKEREKKGGDSDWSRNYTVSGTRCGKIKVALSSSLWWMEVKRGRKKGRGKVRKKKNRKKKKGGMGKKSGKRRYSRIK